MSQDNIFFLSLILFFQMVAVKKICEAFRSIEDALRTFREVEILLRLNEFPHPNIVRLVNVIPARNDADLYLVFDYLPQSLVKVIPEPVLSTTQRRYIAYQIVRAVHFLHSADILHRDLKPSNVLIGPHCEVKLCDFGLARAKSDVFTFYPSTEHGTTQNEPSNDNALHSLAYISHIPKDKREKQDGEEYSDEAGLSDYIATRWYRDPELLFGSNKYGKGVDIWALGCVLLELEIREPAFPGSDNKDQIFLTLEMTGIPSREVLCEMSDEIREHYEQGDPNYHNISHSSPVDTNMSDEQRGGKERRQSACKLILHVIEEIQTQKTKLRTLAHRLGLPVNENGCIVTTPPGQKVGPQSQMQSPTHSQAQTPNIAKHLLYDLLSKMLVFDPKKRISATEALLHPYFAPFVQSKFEPTCMKPLQLRIFNRLRCVNSSTSSQSSQNIPCALSAPNKIPFDHTFYRNQLYHLIAELKVRQLPCLVQLDQRTIHVRTRTQGLIHGNILQVMKKVFLTPHDLDLWDSTMPSFTLDQLASIDALEKPIELFSLTSNSTNLLPTKNGGSNFLQTHQEHQTSNSGNPIQKKNTLITGTKFQKDDLKDLKEKDREHKGGRELRGKFGTTHIKQTVNTYQSLLSQQGSATIGRSNSSTATSASSITTKNKNFPSSVLPNDLAEIRQNQFLSSPENHQSLLDSVGRNLYRFLRPDVWESQLGKTDHNYFEWVEKSGIVWYPPGFEPQDGIQASYEIQLMRDKMEVLRAIELYAHSQQSLFYGEFVDSFINMYMDTVSLPFLTCLDANFRARDNTRRLTSDNEIS